MKVNMGMMDRKVRMGIGAVAAIGAVIAFVTGATVAGIVATVVAVVMIGTSRVGVCPLYLPLGIDTSKGEQAA